MSKGEPCEPGLEFHAATVKDVPQLARMNRQLIIDEGHRNQMTLPALEQRMMRWIAGEEYKAILIAQQGAIAGYALYRIEPDPRHVYLRQFFVAGPMRRHGLGRKAIEWLRIHEWADVRRVRIDVLVGNSDGIAFWRAVGFRDYCLTMELE